MMVMGLTDKDEKMMERALAERDIKVRAPLEAEIAELRRQLEEMKRSRDGWKADAANYAESRGCQGERAEKADDENLAIKKAILGCPKDCECLPGPQCKGASTRYPPSLTPEEIGGFWNARARALRKIEEAIAEERKACRHFRYADTKGKRQGGE